MIALSNKVNQRGIEDNRVSLTQGSVLELPYGDQSADLVTALETIQFWPDIPQALAEIRRVLKPGGRLVIINRYPPEGSVWWNKIQLKSDEAYRSALEATGFAGIKINTEFRKHWIIAEAKRKNKKD